MDIEVLQHYNLKNGGAASQPFVGSRPQLICTLNRHHGHMSVWTIPRSTRDGPAAGA